MTGKIKTTVTKLSYRIEPAHDGGFVGVPSDPTLGNVEGATREDVQQKIRAKLEELVQQQMPRFPFGATVTVDRTGDASPDLARFSEHLGIETSGRLAMPSSERRAKLVQFLIGALVLLGLWLYVFPG
jgi:hypothetical protein